MLNRGKQMKAIIKANQSRIINRFTLDHDMYMLQLQASTFNRGMSVCV